jgi:dephospho-CoA kinase
MIKVAVTGGIGSGKTTVCNVFSKLGVPVFNADKAARYLINNDELIILQLKELFGSNIYLNNNEIDRNKLAKIIFNDNFALKEVNKIIHPEVRKEFAKWVLNKEKPYVIQEAAILFENNQESFFDCVITVTAPVGIRIKRVVKRDGIDEDEVFSRVKNQLDDEIKIKKSHFIIENDGLKLILPQIIKIHKTILNG